MELITFTTDGELHSVNMDNIAFMSPYIVNSEEKGTTLFFNAVDSSGGILRTTVDQKMSEILSHVVHLNLATKKQKT